MLRVSRHLKNIGIVSSLTMVSRVLGLVNIMLVGRIFGAQKLADAFYTAFTLPNLFRRLLGEGSLTAAFVPTLHEELGRGQREAAFRLVNQVTSWLLLASGVIVALAMFAFSQGDALRAILVRFGAEADTIERWLLAADLAVVLFPYLVLVCLAAAFSAALQTLDRFVEPALSPIWLNLAMIGFLCGARYAGWAEGEDGWMRWLCAGVLVGGFFQMAVPAAALVREGWRPGFQLATDGPVRQIGLLMAPTLFGSAIYLVNLAVARFVGLSLSESAVTILNFSTRLMELPIGVFAVAVSTVVFPLIAKHAAAGDTANLARSYRKGMRLILVLNVPAAAGLIALGEPIIRVLFEGGRFGPAETAAMVPVLAASVLGLPLFSFVNLVLRAYYARKDTRTPVLAAALSFVVNLGLSLVLMRVLGTTGLALASTIAIAVQAWFLQARLARKHPELAFHHLGGDIVKVAAASVAMGLAVAAGWWAWARAVPGTGLFDGLGVALLIALGVGLYGAMLWAWRIEGREDLVAVLDRVRSRAGRAGAGS